MCASMFSTPMPRRARKALIDLLGALLLLLPFTLVLFCSRRLMPRAPGRSSSARRRSSGLPLVFVLKTLIPLFALLMALQGIAQAIRALQRAGEAALMPLAETLAVLMVAAVIAALMAGYPVALTLAGVSLAFAALGHVARRR